MKVGVPIPQRYPKDSIEQCVMCSQADEKDSIEIRWRFVDVLAATCFNVILGLIDDVLWQLALHACTYIYIYI